MSETARDLLAKATPTPWFAFHVDDDYAMNCYGVTTEKGFDEDVYPSDKPDGPARKIVALTLYQAARVACHESGRWEEDAALIVYAVNNLGRLLDIEEAARQADYALAAVGAMAKGSEVLLERGQWDSLVDSLLVVRRALAAAVNRLEGQ